MKDKKNIELEEDVLGAYVIEHSKNSKKKKNKIDL